MLKEAIRWHHWWPIASLVSQGVAVNFSHQYFGRPQCYTINTINQLSHAASVVI